MTKPITQREMKIKEIRELWNKIGFNDTAQDFLLGPWNNGWDARDGEVRRILDELKKARDLLRQVGDLEFDVLELPDFIKKAEPHD